MNTLVSIVVTVNDGTGNQTFNVDIANNCLLVWSDAGWNVLSDYYQDVKKEPKKAKQVKDRKCPKAKPHHGAGVSPMLLATNPADPVVAIKDNTCDPSQWP